VPFEILALVGPTASGKSALAIELAQALAETGTRVEIVNGDAMQLYSEMNIGTAKLSESDRATVPHHLFDIITPDQEMTAVEYQRLAREVFAEIISRGSIPLLVGGSMFYISAALDNLDFAPTDPEIRLALEVEAEQLGSTAMHDRLRVLDPKTADLIPAQNIRRVIRALEVIKLTGEPYSSSLPEAEFARPTLMLGIDVERELLKQRIAKRVLLMWEQGLLDEAKGLQERWQLSKTAAKAIGYWQAFGQLSGELTQDQAIEQTVQLTNRYARRQFSWFRRDPRIKWLDSSKPLLEQAQEQIRLYR
jgi:tRNA dimethylallyltransferase